MKYIVIGLFFIVFLFSGCSNKNVQTPNEKQIVVVDEKEEEFLSEFDEELKVEKRIDPLHSYNRVMTNFNDGLYEYVVFPVARVYEDIVHIELRNGFNNFFHNILYPVRFVNNILQGKFNNALDETGRFLVNTTVGFLGMSDQAKDVFHLKAHDEDFGQTLGYWGVGSGPHIVWPFLGPSNLRDSISFYPDSLLNPVNYIQSRDYNLVSNSKESFGVNIFDKLNKTSFTYKAYEKIKQDAVDLYPYLRDMYEQRREKLIKE